MWGRNIFEASEFHRKGTIYHPATMSRNSMKQSKLSAAVILSNFLSRFKIPSSYPQNIQVINRRVLLIALQKLSLMIMSL